MEGKHDDFVWSLWYYCFAQIFFTLGIKGKKVNDQAVLVSNTSNQVCAPQLQSPVNVKRIKDEMIFNKQ